MKETGECCHETLMFGSGDYYVFCNDCGASWVRRKRNAAADVAAPEEANIGVGGSLSGEFRHKKK